MRPKPSVVFETYWKFASERQEIFFKRCMGETGPWTVDPILQDYKFTNVYRACDKTSQYLIREVIYTGDQSPNELLFRILIFKTFNKIETWRWLLRNLGEVTWRSFDFDLYDQILKEAKHFLGSIYSGAYIMASASSFFGHKLKHRNHLLLIKSIIEGDTAQKVQMAMTMEEVFNILRSYPSIGDFLAYQYATDINYSELTDFSETEFVQAGPGARDGIRKCFKDYGDFDEEDIIKLVCDEQEQSFHSRELNFQNLWGRPLQFIDCQNLFCEVDKYSRVAHPSIRGYSDRTRIKQKYKPNRDILPVCWFPPKWNINDAVLKHSEYV